MTSTFDQRARGWDDDPRKRQRARVVADAIRAAIPLPAGARLLEYGAGTGLLSQELAGDVAAITLAEPSTGMRQVLAEKVAAGALPPQSRIWDLDLAKAPAPAEQFDLIATVMALHHIPDLPPVLGGFAALLADGGRLAVVDLEEEDGSFHADGPGFEGHNGLARGWLQSRLEEAGFTDVRFAPCFSIGKHGRTYPLFLATARLR